MSLREVIDTRVLGALRLVDGSTGAVIRRQLDVSSADASFIRNLSHHYVIATARGLEHHTRSFRQPPSEPDIGDVDVVVTLGDPAGRYLPRLASLALPRDPDPEHAGEADSLFQAVPVPMYPTASFPLHPNWSALRASLTVEGSSGTPLAGALLRVIRSSDDTVLARGISDTRGEALVIIPGIPITNFAGSGDNGDNGDNGDDDEEEDEFDASGPVVIAETAATLQVIADDSLPWPVDPQLLEDNLATWLREGDEAITLTLRTGRVETLNLAVDLT